MVLLSLFLDEKNHIQLQLNIPASLIHIFCWLFAGTEFNDRDKKCESLR